MAHTIGIDFGTTKTMVSYLNPATGRPELVRLGRDRDSVPTTIHVDEAGAFLFGEDADDLIETDPEGYCRAFKLQLGEMDPVLLRAGQTAEALAARFLHYVKKECEQTVFHGEPIDTATLTIPVVFSPARKASLERAANAAGFSSVSFLPEPEAAGTAFLRENPTDKFARAVVLDWGGGTLDIAMISRDQEGGIHADRQCAGGRDDIGGEEMDRILLSKIDELWLEKYGMDILDSGENESRLLREAEKTKIFLSRKETTVFRQGPKTIAIPRALFNQLVEPFVSAAVDLIRNALAKNGAKGEAAPDALLLIGGTSLLSVVRETMEKEFPELRVLSWHHSHEAVALGATACEIESAGTEKQVCSDNEPEVRVPADSSSAKEDTSDGNESRYGISPDAIQSNMDGLKPDAAPEESSTPTPFMDETPPRPSVATSCPLQDSSNSGLPRKKIVIRRRQSDQTEKPGKPIGIVPPNRKNDSVPPPLPPIADYVGASKDLLRKACTHQFLPSEGYVWFGKAWLRKWTCWNRRGRATRSEYWWGALACLIELVVVMLFCHGNATLFWIWLGISFYPTLCQEVRRLHDTGHSGKWAIAGVILLILELISVFVPESDVIEILAPFVLVWLIPLVFKLLPSNKGPNRYGEQP